jgi:hypothetical protein
VVGSPLFFDLSTFFVMDIRVMLGTITEGAPRPLLMATCQIQS